MDKWGLDTSKLTSILDAPAEPMTGEESFAVVGEMVIDLKTVLQKCKGLNKHWDCIRKAQIVQEVMQSGIVVGGICMILSADGLSSYGHYWNPPLELHAWWSPYRGTANSYIIDVALPGLIDKGLNTRDEVGPFIVGRTPVILAGTPKPWMQYQARIEIK